MSANVVQCFAPRIAVHETAEVADWLDSRLNLPDLAVLLKPWQSRGVERVNLRSSTYETSTAQYFPLWIDAAASIVEEGQWEHEAAWLDDAATEISQRTESWLAQLDEHNVACASLLQSRIGRL